MTTEVGMTTTDNSTYRTRPPVLRRSDASGEFPFYQPETIGDVDELARLALGATLVLPVPAPPAPPRRLVPTVYLPAPEPVEEWAPFDGWRAVDTEEYEDEPVPAVDLTAVMPEPERRPGDYRARHRVSPELSPWLLLVLALIAGYAGGVTAVTVAFVQAGGLR